MAMLVYRRVREKHTVWSDLIFVEMKWSGTSTAPLANLYASEIPWNTNIEKHIGENMEP